MQIFKWCRFNSEFFFMRNKKYVKANLNHEKTTVFFKPNITRMTQFHCFRAEATTWLRTSNWFRIDYSLELLVNNWPSFQKDRDSDLPTSHQRVTCMMNHHSNELCSFYFPFLFFFLFSHFQLCMIIDQDSHAKQRTCQHHKQNFLGYLYTK